MTASVDPKQYVLCNQVLESSCAVSVVPSMLCKQAKQPSKPVPSHGEPVSLSRQTCHPATLPPCYPAGWQGGRVAGWQVCRDRGTGSPWLGAGLTWLGTTFLCNHCCSFIVVQAWLCNHCCAIMVVQSLLCNHCCAHMVVQPLLRNYRCAINVVQSLLCNHRVPP